MARRTTRVGPSSGKDISNLVAFSNLSADFNLSDPLTNFTPSSFEPCPNSNISSALAEPGTIRGSFTVRKRLSSSPPTGELKGPTVALPPRFDSRDPVSSLSTLPGHVKAAARAARYLQITL